MNILKQNRLVFSLITLAAFSIAAAVALVPKTDGTAALGLIYLIMLIAVLIISFKNPGEYLHKNIFRYRWVLACTLLAALVAFELSGSSVGAFGELLTGGRSENTLLGAPRIARSGEWAVSTPAALAQYKSIFSSLAGGAGVPAMDLSEIFRPFYWGFLLLPPGRGLSFFWMGQLIGLFMVTMEFAMLLTGGNRKFSVTAAFLIAFAPAVQWWIGINGLVELLIFGQLSVLILNRYMNSPRLKSRLLYSVAMAICLGSFAVIPYPSWQVPLGCVFAGAALWVFLTRRRSVVFTHRDFFSLGVLAVIVTGGLISAYYNSSFDVHEAAEESGRRVGTLFQYVMNLFLPYEDLPPQFTPVGETVFFDFFPVGIVMSLLVIFKQKLRDKLLIILLVSAIFLGLYSCVGYPQWLARITLLSGVGTDRTAVVVGFVNILLLLRSMSLYRPGLKASHAAYAAVGLTVVVMSFVVIKFYQYLGGTIMLPLSATILLVSFTLLLLSEKVTAQKIFCGICITLCVVMGVSVNPLEQGISALTDSELYKAVSEIARDDKGLWLVEGENVPIINLPVAAGAATINYASSYSATDINRLFSEAENFPTGFQGAEIVLTDESDPTFTLFSEETAAVIFGAQELMELNIEYILTGSILDGYGNDDVSLERIVQCNGYMIYHVIF